MAGREIFISRLLKIGGIFILCGWMFFIGVLVGRGTSPVSFDTRSFQKKLAAVAAGDKKEHKPEKKLDFDFYEMLQQPALTGNGKFHKADEILPAKSHNRNLRNGEKNIAKAMKIKKSKKNMTFSSPKKRTVYSTSAFSISAHPEFAHFESSSPVKTYTIQIAAYRNLTDALKLIKYFKIKGYNAYRTMGRTGNKIWHRVRIGSFRDMDSAKRTEKKLESINIKGIIIQIDQRVHQ